MVVWFLPLIASCELRNGTRVRLLGKQLCSPLYHQQPQQLIGTDTTPDASCSASMSSGVTCPAVRWTSVAPSMGASLRCDGYSPMRFWSWVSIDCHEGSHQAVAWEFGVMVGLGSLRGIHACCPCCFLSISVVFPSFSEVSRFSRNLPCGRALVPCENALSLPLTSMGFVHLETSTRASGKFDSEEPAPEHFSTRY
jgi:hypothetical protein